MANATKKAPPAKPDQAALDEARERKYRELLSGSFQSKCAQLLQFAPIPCEECLSSALRTDIAEHAARVAQLREMLEASLRSLAEAIVGAETSSDPLAMLSVSDSVSIDKKVAMQQLVTLWVEAVALADRRLDELKPLVKPLEDEAEKVVAKVKEQLTALGSGAESMQAGRLRNSTLAERQFDYQVRHHNTHAVAAIAKAADARVLVGAAVDCAKKSRLRLDDARGFLNREASAFVRL